MSLNPAIEKLNVWGEQLVRFGWSIFWQSSLLITAMFLLDLFFHRKLRPAIRYVLWLVVLIKLLLPPTLAFPGSAAWWMRPREVAPTVPQPATYAVTYGPARSPGVLRQTDYSVAPPPRVKLSAQACALVVATGAALALFGLITWRWHGLRRLLQGTQPAPDWLLNHLVGAQRQIRYARPVRIVLVDALISPALWGLFRPQIVLPAPLIERLTPSQLRAVLLHELIHLRNGDVWINCLQSLLQVVFWWHPLLWCANARIRRVREETVDDAVRLALGEEAETYPPTLLEVARLALARSLTTLGLIGILESRRALRQRVERLMSFPVPRKAGLTLGSLLGILAFTCFAVPMGQAPPKRTGTLAPSTVNQQTGEIVADGAVRIQQGDASIRTGDAKPVLNPSLQNAPNRLLAQNQPMVRGRTKILSKLSAIRLDNVTFEDLPLTEVVRYLREESKKRDPEGKGVNFIINPTVDPPPQAAIDPTTGLPAATAPIEIADVGSIAIRIVPSLTDVLMLDLLDAIIKVADKPLQYSIEDYAVTFRVGRTGAPRLFSRVFRVDPNTFAQGLESVAAVPIGNFQTGGQGGGGGIGFPRVQVIPGSPGGQSGQGGAQSAGGISGVTRPATTIGPLSAMRQFFADAGVDLTPPKSFFYSERLGTLIMYATMEDLQAIENALGTLSNGTPQPAATIPNVRTSTDRASAPGIQTNIPVLGDLPIVGPLFRSSTGKVAVANSPGVADPPPQINIRAKFVELLDEDAKLLGLTNTPSVSAAVTVGQTNGPAVTILSDPQFRVVLHALEQREGVGSISEHNITTLSGREAQMQNVALQNIVRLNPLALIPPGVSSSNVYQTEPLYSGPFLDIIPFAAEDDTIQLNVTGKMTEFVGYDEPERGEAVAVYLDGKAKTIKPPHPRTHVRTFQATAVIWDGQTLVLGRPRDEMVTVDKKGKPVSTPTATKKNLFVFISATLIDSAGNALRRPTPPTTPLQSH